MNTLGRAATKSAGIKAVFIKGFSRFYCLRDWRYDEVFFKKPRKTFFPRFLAEKRVGAFRRSTAKPGPLSGAESLFFKRLILGLFFFGSEIGALFF